HQLRSGWHRLVHRLLSYYGGVRLPAPVHHRLRLLAFPMRTGGPWTERPDAGSPRFRRSPFARDVFLDPRTAAVPRLKAPLILRSTITTASAPAMRQFRGSIDTPCNCCVRFVAVVAAGSRNTHYRATRYGLLGPVFHRLDRASLLAPSVMLSRAIQHLIDP